MFLLHTQDFRLPKTLERQQRVVPGDIVFIRKPLVHSDCED
jgi:hypothetical protein